MKSRGCVWKNPQLIPSERDMKDGSGNLGSIAFSRTHYKLRKRVPENQYTCNCHGCGAKGIDKLKETPFEKELDGENSAQPKPRPKCSCIKESRLMAQCQSKR